MNKQKKPPIPISGVVYGEIIYWCTCVSALVVIFGTIISFLEVDPKIPVEYLLNAVFEGRSVEAVWAGSALQKPVKYYVHNVKIAVVLLFVVGFTGGFFGLGGGWAVVPVLNLVMSVPLKVSAATSGVLLAMGNSAAIWPYINAGALIGVVAAPWMLGQIIGGIVGAHVLSGIKAAFVRKLLIVMLFLTSLKLLSRGIEGLFNISIPFI